MWGGLLLIRSQVIIGGLEVQSGSSPVVAGYCGSDFLSDLWEGVVVWKPGAGHHPPPCGALTGARVTMGCGKALGCCLLLSCQALYSLFIGGQFGIHVHQ